MTTRITAGAFLICGNKVLLMKRGLHKKMGPGMWAGIGGHMEMGDITDPRALNLIETCYREVEEESGIAKKDIFNLKLRYIAVRKLDTEVRFHHFFMGEVAEEMPLPKCEEGELHWMDINDVCNLQMSTTTGSAVKHWLDNPKCEAIYMVAVNKTNDGATVSEL